MSDDSTPTQPEAVDDATAAPAAPESTDLGDAGKKALAAERAARRQAEKAAAELAARVKEFEDASKSEAEKAAARAEAAETRAAEAEARALRLEVADEAGVPANLRKFLTATDADALREQASTLMAEVAAATAPRRPQPDPSQGAKPGTSGPVQLTRADMASMTPDQISQALDEGRFTDLLAGKSQ